MEGRWGFRALRSGPHALFDRVDRDLAGLIFNLVGLYKRSFALSVKDELYYTILALIIGVLPQLTVFTLIPSISTSRLLLLASLRFASRSAAPRALAHSVRNSVDRRRPRRIAIVGKGDRISSVAQSLGMAEGSVLLRLDIPDIDATVGSRSFSVDLAGL